MHATLVCADTGSDYKTFFPRHHPPPGRGAGTGQSEPPGLLRGSECMVRFTREVPIPPLLRATRTHIQHTATAVLRAKTHHRLEPPYLLLPPPKAQGWACRRGSGSPHPSCSEGIVWERPYSSP